MKINLSIGVLDVVFIVFVVLKFLNIINWSWFLICLPIFIKLIIIVIFVIIKVYYKSKYNF